MKAVSVAKSEPTAFFLLKIKNYLVRSFSVAAAAIAFAIVILCFGLNNGENLAAGGAFKLVDLFDVAFVDIHRFAASGAFKLQAFAAITAIAIVVAIIAIAIIVIVAIAAVAIAIVIVAAVEIFFYSAEILVDLFNIFAKSSVFILKILNGKREILEQVNDNSQKLTFALACVDLHTFHKTLDVCSLFRYVHIRILLFWCK